MFIGKIPYPSTIVWGGDVLCAISAATTGPNPKVDSIYRITFLPMDCDFKPFKPPFTINMIPIQRGNLGKEVYDRAVSIGLKYERGFEMFEKWWEDLVPYNKQRGAKNKIIPLAANYYLLYPFITDWIGFSLYSIMFSTRHRDIFTIASYVDDTFEFCVETTPFKGRDKNVYSDNGAISIAAPYKTELRCLQISRVYRRLVTKRRLPHMV
jgi:hypothetical protein